MALKFKLPLPN